MKHLKLNIIAGALITASLIALFLWINYFMNVKEVQLVFPVGFRGTVKVLADCKGGVNLYSHENKIVLTIPESGVLELSGSLPTTKWHRLTARYADGSNIPIVNPGVVTADNQIALRALGLKNGTAETWYELGTTDDAKAAYSKMWPLPGD